MRRNKSKYNTESMRKAFNKKIAAIIKNKELRCRMEFRPKEWIHDAITTLEVSKRDPTHPCNKSEKWIEKLNEFNDKYEVSEVSGEKTLHLKTIASDDVSSRFVPILDWFYVLWDAHIATDHGDTAKMEKYLEEHNHYVPLNATSFLIDSCKVCTVIILPRPEGLVVEANAEVIHAGFVEIYDMRAKPDGEYLYVMHYKDLISTASFLRALKTTRASEAAQELLLIFLDIGCPGVLHTPVDKSFTEAIIKHLNKNMPEWNIRIGERMKSPKHSGDIDKKIITWMSCSAAPNWTRGIHVVQYRLNKATLYPFRHSVVQKIPAIKRLLSSDLVPDIMAMRFLFQCVTSEDELNTLLLEEEAEILKYEAEKLHKKEGIYNTTVHSLLEELGAEKKKSLEEVVAFTGPGTSGLSDLRRPPLLKTYSKPKTNKMVPPKVPLIASFETNVDIDAPTMLDTIGKTKVDLKDVTIPDMVNLNYEKTLPECKVELKRMDVEKYFEMTTEQTPKKLKPITKTYGRQSIGKPGIASSQLRSDLKKAAVLTYSKPKTKREQLETNFKKLDEKTNAELFKLDSKPNEEDAQNGTNICSIVKVESLAEKATL